MNLADAASIPKEQTNVWLKQLLGRPPLRQDWFAFLIYNGIAKYFGNSQEGSFGPSPCWYVSLSDAADINAPDFKGIFLTQKGSLGLLSHGHVARFYKGVAFIGNQHAAFEGIGIRLVAVGLDIDKNVVFVLSDDYQRKFGIPDVALASVLGLLKKAGGLVISVSELLASQNPIEVLWTAPSDQADPNNPQAVQSTKPVAPDFLPRRAA